MSRNRRSRDPLAAPIDDLGIARREADEPDRDDLGALAAGDADWVAAAERVTGRRVRPGTEADADVSREFWGDAPGWRTSGAVRRTRDRTAGGRAAPRSPQPTSSTSDADDAAVVVGIGEGVTGVDGLLSRWTSGWRRPAPPTARNGRVERTRTHRVVKADDGRPAPDRPEPRGRPAPHRRPDAAEVDEVDEVEFDHGVPAPPTPPGSRPTLAERTGLDAVDPLVRRLGALVLIGVLLVPVALALRSPSTERELGIRSLASGEMADWLPMPAVNRDTTPTDPGTTDATRTPGDDLDDDTTSTGDPTAADTTDGADGTTDCALGYTVGAGDYWLRLAEESGVPLAELLSTNGATIETAIHPGDEVCLPEGASMPAPPPPPTTTAAAEMVTASDDTTSNTTSTGSSDVAASQSATTTTSPPTTQAPATTAPPTTAAPTTTPPTTTPATTAPPTTAAPSRPPSSANPPPEQIRAMIREVFPADEHEMAINVARRESTFRANAYNGWCCHGIFQIHWRAHRSWLNERGITSVEQLYDARTNIELAYAIFQRSGGWGPWSQTAY